VPESADSLKPLEGMHGLAAFFVFFVPIWCFGSKRLGPVARQPVPWLPLGNAGVDLFFDQSFRNLRHTCSPIAYLHRIYARSYHTVISSVSRFSARLELLLFTSFFFMVLSALTNEEL